MRTAFFSGSSSRDRQNGIAAKPALNLACHAALGGQRRARINRRLRLLALRTVLPRRAEIGGYIAAVVDNWDTATLVNRLELQVGKDLQYIRINGTLVGGLVGLLIFTLSRAFGG